MLAGTDCRNEARTRSRRLRAFGPRHSHQVINTGTVAAVSVHVYTPALTVMNHSRLEPQGLRDLGAEQAGVNW